MSVQRAEPPESVRAHCLQVMAAWERQEGWAADLIDRTARSAALERRDRAFLQDLVFTQIRNLSLLDAWIRELTDERHLDHRTRRLLRMGVTECLLLQSAAHAAVDQTVGLGGKAKGLINAVLRRALRERSELEQKALALPMEQRFSHPDFLLRRWREQFGELSTEQLLAWNQRAAPLWLRVNKLHAAAIPPELWEVELLEQREDWVRCGSLPLHALETGSCYAQDPSTGIAPRLLAPQPGERVLDACAAPGGKTAYLAQLMANEGEILACDASPKRLQRLRENLQRLHVSCVKTQQMTWGTAQIPAEWLGHFDRALVDAPCSNTGVMQRRVDVRWRLSEPELHRLSELQQRILPQVAACVRRGGTLVYSTCSIDKEENEARVEEFLRTHPEWEYCHRESILPQRDSLDGAFASELRKSC